jgi:hypothetical protein
VRPVLVHASPTFVQVMPRHDGAVHPLLLTAMAQDVTHADGSSCRRAKLVPSTLPQCYQG